MTTFLSRFSQPKPLLLDGATGTELAKRHVATPAPLWSAAALRTHPEKVYEIHRDYLAAGADLITTNTFRTHARNVGSAEEARALTYRAVELAKRAVQDSARNAWVAGSVAPLEDCYSPHLTPDSATCRVEQAAMVRSLADAGVDVLLIETMNTRHEAEAAALAAQQTGLPFIVSLILNEAYELLSGESLEETVQAITAYQPAALLINCIPTRHITTALRRLKTLTDLPIGAYGNMDTPPDVTGWSAEPLIAPAHYCDYAGDWLALGAKIIGSCCGSSPDHTTALRNLIDSGTFTA